MKMECFLWVRNWVFKYYSYDLRASNVSKYTFSSWYVQVWSLTLLWGWCVQIWQLNWLIVNCLFNIGLFKKWSCSSARHEAYRERRGIAPLMLNLSTVWSWVVNFMSVLLIFLGRISGTFWKGGWMGLRPGLDISEMKFPLAPVRIWTPDSSAHSLVTILTRPPWFTSLSLTLLNNSDTVGKSWRKTYINDSCLICNIRFCVKYFLLNLTFCGPCIMIYFHNEDQQDAFFFSKFISIIILYMFQID